MDRRTFVKTGLMVSAGAAITGFPPARGRAPRRRRGGRSRSAKLFGAWEMNWLPRNRAHDVTLVNAAGPPEVAFFMYPQGETGATRKDCLDPPKFKYTIGSREIKA